jgi:hypothetical protein
MSHVTRHTPFSWVPANLLRLQSGKGNSLNVSAAAAAASLHDDCFTAARCQSGMAMIPVANEAAAVAATASSTSAAAAAAPTAAAIADVCDEDDAAAFVDFIDDHEFGEAGAS